MVQPSLQPPGGGNGVCAWMLQALRRDYRIDLLSWRPVDLAAVNAYFGTDLEGSDIRPLPLPRVRWLLNLIPTSSTLLKKAVLTRRCRRIAGGYAALLSANNETDFGRPGIQYVHYPWNYRPRPAVDLRWYHSPLLLRGYYAVVDGLSAFDRERVAHNLTMVNSNWTGELVRRLYPGLQPRTVHPPVAGEFPQVPWEEREDGVVVLGRISPEKRVDLAIEVVRRVRQRGYPVLLHVVGSRDDSPTFGQVVELAKEHRDWIELHLDLPRHELCRLLTRQRYGLHAMAEEHYGMAVAEMVVAGLVPFAPDGGGQREILDGVPELLWRTPEDAVEGICTVVEDPDLQRRLRDELAPRKDHLGADRFVREVRDLVGRFVARARWNEENDGEPVRPAQ
jgi:glycosyltransferase involved in cell wall biosynthesis